MEYYHERAPNGIFLDGGLDSANKPPKNPNRASMLSGTAGSFSDSNFSGGRSLVHS